MPAGMSDPVCGYLAFCAVKAVGYTAAAAVISRTYNRPGVNAFLQPTANASVQSIMSAFVIGPVRTLIGMATGAALFAVSAFS